MALLLVPAGSNAQPRDVDIDLRRGFNLFSYPVTVPDDLLCADMQSVLQATALMRLDAQGQQLETCAQPGANFPIVAGAGYVVERAASGQLTLSGEPGCPQLDLSPGLNLIGVPTPPAGLSCFDLLQRFDRPEVVATIQRFDPERGAFTACTFAQDGSGVPAGEDFAIVSGEAYLVSLREAQTGFDPNDLAVCCLEPQITGVDPVTGPIGTEVTITGTGFDCGVPTLTLDGARLPILSLSSDAITTIVPTGGEDGRFSLTTPGGTVIAPPALSFDIVPSRTFSLAVAPGEVSVLQGSSTTLRVNADGSAGFSDAIALSVAGLPQGVSAEFYPEMITAGQSGRLILSAAVDAPLASATLTVTGQASIDGSPVSLDGSTTLSVIAGGRTAVLGQFLLTDETPMPGVRVTLAGLEAVTDAAGNFQLIDVPAGLQALAIDTTPFDPALPTYQVDLTLTAGEALALAPFYQLVQPPPEAFTPIVQGAAQDQVFTSFDTPGASLTLPAGATILGWDGTPKTQLAIVRRDPDKLPVPPPPGPTRSVYHPMFGTSSGGIPSTVLPVTAPNDLDLSPGEQADLWYYDAAPIPGAPGEWVSGGTATVSADGQLLVSDPGSGIARFCGACGQYCLTRRQAGQPNTNPEAPEDGDPVNLPLGQMIARNTDMFLPGRIPAVVQRIHNPYDPFGGTAGVELGLGSGWTLSVDMVLQAESAELRRLIEPGNARYPFSRQPDGTFVNTRHRRFAGAVITPVAGGHVLRLKDGTQLRFAESQVFGLEGVDFLVAQVDRNGNRLEIERNSLDQIVRLREPSGRTLEFSYGANNLISAITDPIGRTVSYTYTGTRLATVTDPAGGVTRYTYDGEGRILTITDARDIVWMQNQYDATGRISTQTQADGGQWRFEYHEPCRPGVGLLSPRTRQCTVGSADAFPTSAVVTDPRGSTTVYDFSTAGDFANEIVDALGQTTRFERDPTGQVLSVTDPLGRVTRFDYDARGNLLQTTDPAGNVTRLTYEPVFNQVTQITDALNNTVLLDYDDRGNLARITDPLSNVTTLSYDEFGQLIAWADPLDQETTFEYDPNGNLVRITDPLGNELAQDFDPVSRRIAVTDPRGLTTRIVYDALNQIVEVVDPLRQSTRFAFDPNGNLLSVTDALNQTTGYAYDATDRVVQRTDPLGVSESFAYDSLGNLVGHTDRNGQIGTFEYDPDERLTRSVYEDATVDYAYDVVGRLTQALDTAEGEILLSYDSVDRLAEELTPRSAVRYVYDGIDRRLTMTVAGQNPVGYEYDGSSRLTRITQGARVVDFVYDALDRRSRLTLPNGVATDYAYDAASRLTALTYRRPDTSVLGELTYDYDAAGNRTSMRGSFARVGLPEAVAMSSYDAGNRQLVFGPRQMTYDANGNLISITEAAGTTNLTWDARGRLVGLGGVGLSASFAYDAFGRRALRSVSGEDTEFVYDGVDVVQEVDRDGTRNLLRSLYVDELLADVDGAFPIADGLNSTLAVVDAGGVVQTSYTYSPYGNTRTEGASANTFQFTGREYDNTGLYFYRARYYHPGLKRFVGEDPIGFAAGDRNLYAYVRGNPVNFTDPSGNIAWWPLYWWVGRPLASWLGRKYMPKTIAGFWFVVGMKGLEAFDIHPIKDLLVIKELNKGEQTYDLDNNGVPDFQENRDPSDHAQFEQQLGLEPGESLLLLPMRPPLPERKPATKPPLPPRKPAFFNPPLPQRKPVLGGRKQADEQ